MPDKQQWLIDAGKVLVYIEHQKDCSPDLWKLRNVIESGRFNVKEESQKEQPMNPHDWQSDYKRSEHVCTKCGGTYWTVGGGWDGECAVLPKAIESTASPSVSGGRQRSKEE